MILILPGLLPRMLTWGNPMILEVKNLHSYYGKSHVLQGVDMALTRRNSSGLSSCRRLCSV